MDIIGWQIQIGAKKKKKKMLPGFQGYTFQSRLVHKLEKFPLQFVNLGF